MLVIGHRGAPAYEPENTLRSFARALELGADMLEFDVNVLPSGEAVIFHDRNVDRTTNGSGPLLHHSFRQLRRLDAGKGEQIPTLQEVLDFIDHRVPVVVELKTVGSAGPVAHIIEEYVQQHGWRYDQFYVSCFHHPELHLFKTSHAPHIRVVAPLSTVPLRLAKFAEELDAVAITPNIEFITQALVDDAHARGMQVFAYTASTFEDTQEQMAFGVDAVFSNAPDQSHQAIEAGLKAGIRY